jgi:excisionase family DNA binding protein
MTPDDRNATPAESSGRSSGQVYLDTFNRVQAVIDNAGQTGASRFEIHHAINRRIPKAFLDHVVTCLLDSGDYEEFTRPTKGRPATCYRRRTDPAGIWLTVTEICRNLQIPHAEWETWRERGQTPLHRVLPGGTLRVRRADFDNWLDSLTEE